MSKPYRMNAGMIVFNSSGLVLAGDRIQYPGHFQLPQGGIDEGEKPRDAAIRELAEELGLRISEPVGEIPDWLTYEFPQDVPDHLKRYRGQKQKWLYFYWDGDPSTLDLDAHEREFNSVRWMSFSELTENIIEFKKDVYQKLQKHAESFIADFLG